MICSCSGVLGFMEFRFDCVWMCVEGIGASVEVVIELHVGLGSMFQNNYVLICSDEAFVRICGR